MSALIAPDKFRGTATAVEAAEALAAGVADTGHRAVLVPLADGGEGTLDALGGATDTTTVTGPLGGSVPAQWRLCDGRTVVETAARRVSSSPAVGRATTCGPRPVAGPES